MSLGTELSLGPGDIVLDGDPVPSTKRGTAAPPCFSAHFTLARSPISATAELLLLDRFRDYQVVRREKGVRMHAARRPAGGSRSR